MAFWNLCIVFLSFTAYVQECATTVQQRYHTILRNCMQPRPPSYCKPLAQAWYYAHGFCKKADPTVCAGGANIFPSLRECQKECKSGKKGNRQRCRKLPLFGSCKPVLQTWRYDTTTGYCKRLNYTICGLGTTEIATEEACITSCKGKKSLKIICSLSPHHGPCNFLRKGHWFFKPELNDCFKFPEGKCATNANGFATKRMCLERCSYETS
uniref:Putative trilaris n=1 Tax=Rhipicephalus pulchellus TaxID=72859 RepID=L7LPP8_RHIPC